MILRALLFAALAAAHEHGTPAVPGEEEEPEDVPLSYWHLESPARSWLHAHITLMLLAWIFLLPLSAVFKFSHSRFHLPIHLLFLALNAAGIVSAAIHHARTPDLVPGAAHRNLGFALLGILAVQAGLGLLGGVGKRETQEDSETLLLTPEDDGDEKEFQRLPLTKQLRANSSLTRISGRLYTLILRLLIPMGYIQLLLGPVLLFGLMTHYNRFNVLAHLIKGGIFLALGVITVLRFAGAFAARGWDWSYPPHHRPRPTFEMVESLLLLLYGAPNMFLERLANPGGAWSHADLQHVAIAAMMAAGGVCGVVVEVVGCAVNPVPSAVVAALGVVVALHRQNDELAKGLHVVWGAGLVWAAGWRWRTYAQQRDGRPVSELGVAGGLMLAGMVFMMSNRETVRGVERAGGDVGLVVTVAAAVTFVGMAWGLGIMEIGKWAEKKGVKWRESIDGEEGGEVEREY